MSIRTSVIHTLVASGQQVSGDIGIAGANEVAVLAPTVTSCQAFFKTNYNTTSANFFRAGKLDGSGDFAWALGVGSKYQYLEVVRGAAHMRIELGVAQTGPRSFAVLTKL